uniref:Uncharacterized protein n=1 Tax=Schistosoma japonicum TaxID=6182 RepID=C1LII4_SCHJA|nr:hypothetical protein [Schistosoma japonicum]CAX74512.1 hypothetical protein [Schistosoma japonicum]
MDRKLRIIIITVVLLLLCGFGFFAYLFVTHKNTTQHTTTNQIQSDSVITLDDIAKSEFLNKHGDRLQVHEPLEGQNVNYPI